ncbi:MAG: TlpA family protein disulfide reductase [Phascolarctobacterium sp.]|nr:TlpA family protein disulfide reductase [Phascolarctobacterium sp.]
MKNKVWMIIAVAFIAIMLLATALYPALSEKYSADSAPDNTESDTLVQADDFTVYDSEMNEVKLSDYFGKPIIINFWASWCNPCKSELPAFNSLYEKYKDDVVFLMINLTDGQIDTESSVKTFISDNGYSFPVYYDIESDASDSYNVRSIPETVFINADGSLYDTRVGAMSEDVLEDYIKQLAGEDDG